MKKYLFLFMLMAAVLVAAPSAWAVVVPGPPNLNVTVGADSDCSDGACDLSSALVSAQSDGADNTLILNASTYAVTSAGFYTAANGEDFRLDLVGAGPGLTILDATNNDIALDISTTSAGVANSSAIVSVSGMTFINGNNGGTGGVLEITTGNAPVFVNSIEIHNSFGNGDGGGMSIDTFDGDITLENSIFNANEAAWGGGGVHIKFDNTSTITINQVEILGNQSNGGEGGGLYVHNTGTSGSFYIYNSTIWSNASTAAGGGGMTLEGKFTKFMQNLTVTDNFAYSGTGGGINVISNYGLTTLYDSDVSSNWSAWDGGAIYFNGILDTAPSSIYREIRSPTTVQTRTAAPSLPCQP